MLTNIFSSICMKNHGKDVDVLWPDLTKITCFIHEKNKQQEKYDCVTLYIRGSICSFFLICCCMKTQLLCFDLQQLDSYPTVHPSLFEKYAILVWKCILLV